MIDVKPRPDQIEHATGAAEQSAIQNVYAGTKEQQRIGFLGETVICDHFGFLRPDPIKYDGGFDICLFDQKIDVKTMGRTTAVRDYYVHNFMDHQKGHPADCFIFCSYNQTNGILTICGFISKKEFFRLAEPFKKGELRTKSDGSQFPAKADMFEIQQDKLMPIDEWDDIVDHAEREKTISETRKLLE